MKLRWFQFRLLNRILCTNTLLVKIRKSDDPKCTFCNETNESIDHLFWDCEFTRKFWTDVQSWFNSILNTNLSFRKDLVLFGNYQYKDYVFNNILLVLKFNIYKSRVKKEKPSFAFGKNDLNSFYFQEKYLYNANLQNHAFNAGITGKPFLKSNFICLSLSFRI